MKVDDWKLAGPLFAAILDVWYLVKGVLWERGVPPQVLEWLKSDEGKKGVSIAIDALLVEWKAAQGRRVMEETATPSQPVTVDFDYPFANLIFACGLEGRDADITETNFPTVGGQGQVPTEFHPITLGYGASLAEVCAVLTEAGCRPAQPLEFLHWLRQKPNAGLRAPLLCLSCVWMDSVMEVTRGGGGGRCLHRTSTIGQFSGDAQFLAVKIR